MVSGVQTQNTPIPYVEVFFGFLLSFSIDIVVKIYGLFSVPYGYIKISNAKITMSYLATVWLSSGYVFAKICKGMIVPSAKYANCMSKDCDCVKHLKGKFINRANKGNLFVSASILLPLIFIDVVGINIQSIPDLSILIAAVIFRVISRSFEIIYAFTKDVLSNKKVTSSNLDKYDRIRLALSSYIENILNFCTAYYFLASIINPKENTSIGSSVLESIGTATISNVHEASCLFEKFLVNLQVVTALALVVLSLAAYLSRAE